MGGFLGQRRPIAIRLKYDKLGPNWEYKAYLESNKKKKVSDYRLDFGFETPQMRNVAVLHMRLPIRMEESKTNDHRSRLVAICPEQCKIMKHYWWSQS